MIMIKVKQFQFSLFGVNTYLVIDEATRMAAVIDPAMDDVHEETQFSDYVKNHDAEVSQIINTHMHLDHCFGINYVKNKYGVPIKAHGADSILAEIIDQQYQMFGMPPKGEKVIIDVELTDGELVSVGESQLQVIATPGHTQGGICLYNKETKLLFSGDTIFKGSVGRTDLPGGDQRTLIRSIRERILSLPDDVTILPGHGPATTVAYEKIHNPYI